MDLEPKARELLETARTVRRADECPADAQVVHLSDALRAITRALESAGQGEGQAECTNRGRCDCIGACKHGRGGSGAEAQADEKGRPLTFWGGLAQPEAQRVDYVETLRQAWDRATESERLALRDLLQALSAQAEAVSARDVFRIAGGDVECFPSPTSAQALNRLRYLRECYDEALAAPQQPEAQAGGAVAEFDDWPEFHAEAMGCGLEDRGITDRYEAMRYGWEEAIESVASRGPLYTTQPAKVPEGDDVVGHKTFSDGRGGFRHEPLTRAEADALIAHCNSEDERRKALMPDEQSALRMMMDAHTRLTDMGWRDPIYCPKDGSTFEVIEPGSTGIHKCIYMGEWPKGSWWALDDGDMYPSRPVLFRALAAASAPKE